MAITPQAIKDQEFQSKFRGYDTVEVKAYLELVAEEFFELLEHMRKQEDEISELNREKELAADIKQNLEDDIAASQRTVDELRREVASYQAKEEEFNKDLEEMQTALEDFEQERKEYEEEISATEGRVSEIDEKLQESRAEIEGLRNKIEILEEQSQELRKEEVDFKRTIGAAQQFADDLTRRTEEKASAALQAAQQEIEELRREAFETLSRLPEEISQLSEQRRQVREEMRGILTKHLATLDDYPDGDITVKTYEYDELFPNASIISDEQEPEGGDELDDLDLDLSLPAQPDTEQVQEDDSAADEDGGITYRSGP
jgi:DivIVA domain-containing protein